MLCAALPHRDTQRKMFSLDVECLPLCLCMFVPYWFPQYIWSPQIQKHHFTHFCLCLAHIETLMLYWSVRRLKQFKGSFVWLALESPWSQKNCWTGREFLGITASWTPVPWNKNAMGRYGCFFCFMGCNIPHKYPRVCTPVWERWVRGLGAG